MARQASVSIENNFSKGLLTEVTGVNSPENSVSDSLDTVFDRLGRAMGRRGFKFEDDYVQRNILNSGVVNEFIWETNSESASKTFVVTQAGRYLRFFEVSSTGSISAGLEAFSVDLNTYRVSNFTIGQVQEVRCAFTIGKGYLFVAHPFCNTFYIEYNEDSNTITARSIAIKIRDFEGVEDNLDTDTRPSTLTNAHKYNLYNQGWYTKVVTTAGTKNALVAWTDSRSDNPSNADAWWYFTQINSAALEYFSPTAIEARTGFYGNTPAAKGHYILNAFSTNRSSLSGITVTESTSGGLRPSAVAFYAGRAFYAGVNEEEYSSTIYFSQIIEENNQLGRCYQRNDPTSKEAFDLLASDGGTIKVQEIGIIHDMRVIGTSIYLFASNGIWSVSGTDSTPFKATDYQVSKISSFPAISKTNIVDVGGTPLWWNHEGIFTLQKSQVGLTSDVTNLTQTTIQRLYDSIPYYAKLSAKGAFNDQLGLVYWIYNHQSNGSDNEYTRILVFDVISTAFYILSVPYGNQIIKGLVAVRSASEVFEAEGITDDLGDPVLDSLGDVVTVDISLGLQGGSKVFKFLTATGTNLTFSEINDTSYLDWGTTSYSPYFVTGYRIRGELLKVFQSNYLTVISEDVTNSSCYVQGIWDYANSPDSGKFTNPQQVYRPKTFRSYKQSRLRMRGSGRSLQFKFFGEAGKPFIIVGWAAFETSNANA